MARSGHWGDHRRYRAVYRNDDNALYCKRVPDERYHQWVFVYDSQLPDDEHPEFGYGHRYSWPIDPHEYHIISHYPPIVGDNKYHPNMPAWFDVDDVCRHISADPVEWMQALCSGDAVKVATCLYDVATYYGADNLDGYPTKLTREQWRSGP